MDTVIACADGERYAILIPALFKRQILEYLRRRGQSAKMIYLRMFAAGLFLLLCDVAERLALVIIDEEYQGHEADLRGMLLEHFRASGLEVQKDAITFDRIGNRSNAHDLAWRVRRGEIAPNYTVTLEELLGLLAGENAWGDLCPTTWGASAEWIPRGNQVTAHS